MNDKLTIIMFCLWAFTFGILLGKEWSKPEPVPSHIEIKESGTYTHAYGDRVTLPDEIDVYIAQDCMVVDTKNPGREWHLRTLDRVRGQLNPVRNR